MPVPIQPAANPVRASRRWTAVGQNELEREAGVDAASTEGKAALVGVTSTRLHVRPPSKVASRSLW
jgi:hypothetical protein